MIISTLQRKVPEVGDVWQEIDPRMTRFVRVMSILEGAVTISRCWPNGELWDSETRTTAKYSRFNGRRGGYGLHLRTVTL